MNTLTLVFRFLVAPVALLFAGLGFSFWIAPETAAREFGLAPSGAAGLSSLRADLGGLFVGLALVCWLAAWTKRRSWALAAALVLAAVAGGRLLGWLAEGVAAGELAKLAAELGAAGVLVGSVRNAAPAASPVRVRRFRFGRLLAGLAVVALGGAVTLVTSSRLQWALYARGAARATAAPNTALLADDALRVLVVGSSAPLPSAARAKAAVAVFAGGKFYLVDSGPESTENLLLWNVPMASIGGVLLTHFHSDHIGDLGELQLQTWAGGRRAPLAVYGGPGVESVVAGFNQAYRLDQGYRTEHHGEQVMPSAAWGLVARTVELDGEPTPAKDRRAIVLDDGELRITALEVDHAPIAPAYAFRFDYKGRSVVITGDMKDHPPLATGAAGADLLVSEAIATSMTKVLGTAARSAGRGNTAAVMHDIEDYHVTPEQAARLANEAGVKHLAFYHLLPAADGWLLRRLFAEGVDAVRAGDWTIAEDGSLYTLPLGSPAISIGRLGG